MRTDPINTVQPMRYALDSLRRLQVLLWRLKIKRSKHANASGTIHRDFPATQCHQQI